MKRFLLLSGLGLITSALCMDEPDLEMGVKRPAASAARKLDFASPAATPMKAARSVPVEIDPESLEEILLFPEGDLQQTKIGKWWHSMSQQKKMALELLGLLGVDIGVEASRYFIGNDMLSWLVGYGVAKQAAGATSDVAFWKKMSVAGVVWGLGGVIYLLGYFDAVTIAATCMMYLVHVTFTEYAKRTGRSTGSITDFRDLPKDLQRELITKISA